MQEKDVEFLMRPNTPRVAEFRVKPEVAHVGKYTSPMDGKGMV